MLSRCSTLLVGAFLGCALANIVGSKQHRTRGAEPSQSLKPEVGNFQCRNVSGRPDTFLASSCNGKRRGIGPCHWYPRIRVDDQSFDTLDRLGHISHHCLLWSVFDLPGCLVRRIFRILLN